MAIISQYVISTDAAIPAASVSSLANTSYAIGPAIENRPSSVTSGDLGDLRIPISSATPSAGGFLTVWFLPAIDSGTTNYASPNAAAAAPSNLIAGTYNAVAAATTEIAILNCSLPPYSFKVLIQNNLGVAITASAAITITRRALQSV